MREYDESNLLKGWWVLHMGMKNFYSFPLHLNDKLDDNKRDNSN